MSAHMHQTEALIRDLEPLWLILTDGDRYRVPEAGEDFKELGPFPYFTIGHTWIYASDEIKETVLKFGELLRKGVGLERLSLSTVAKAVQARIKSHFSSDQPMSLADYLTEIINQVIVDDRPRMFLYVVSGLELVDMQEIAYGSWRITRFTDEMAEKLAKRDIGDEQWRSNVERWLREDFYGQTCMIIDSRGDHIMAGDNALAIGRYVINSLRYFASVHLTGKHYSHAIDIRLQETKTGGWVSGFAQTLDRYESNFTKSDSNSRHKYKINNENLATLRSDWNAEVLWSLLERLDRTDLEEAIITALTWFGDAQAENNVNVAYVKYWIALEALITAHEERGITKRLQKGIRVALKQTTGEDVNDNTIKEAYDLRSRIAHGTGLLHAERRDRDCLNRWACQCITLFLRLHSLGYKDRRQVESQASRIYQSLSESNLK